MNPDILLKSLHRRVDYNDVLHCYYLLEIYLEDIMKLYNFLEKQAKRSPELNNISSFIQLYTELYEAIEQTYTDLDSLVTAMRFCLAEANGDLDFKLPYCRFIKPSLLFYAFIERTHPIIKLYDKYEHLFVIKEHFNSGISYIPRKIIE